MFSKLNEQQKNAVQSPDGPLLIVAGAGSGKTKTLTSRLAFLIVHKNINPNNILAITFTNKAANQMKSRVTKILQKINSKQTDKKHPFVGTFHSFGTKVLRENTKFFGRTENFSIYDRNDSLKMIKEILELDSVHKRISRGEVSSLLKEISRIKSELLNKSSYVHSIKSLSVWNNFTKYENRLKNNNAFDFDDLIEKVVHLFKKEQTILKKYQRQYKYILVDEYQDVNTAQYVLIKIMAEKYNNINVVGDDQQSIYKFRFSDFRNFLNFDKDWPNSKIVILEQNYRSTKNIVEAASILISRNKSQKPKKLWTKNKVGSKIYIVEHQDEYDQADYVTDKVTEFLKQKKNIGILFRTNAQSRSLEHILVDKGIEYNLYGAVSFYDRREIKDIMSILRATINPKDTSSISRIEKIFYKRRTKKILDNLKDKATMPPTDLINYIIKFTNYFEYLEKNYLNYEERFENIVELIYFSKQFKDTSLFIENISLSNPLDWNNKKKKRRMRDFSGVNLMTIHLSKGLEFDSVIIVGANEGLLPHKRSQFSQEKLEEERRLMYVAMTRAKEHLIINYYDTPSRFLSEIPGNLIEYVNSNTYNNFGSIIEYN